MYSANEFLDINVSDFGAKGDSVADDTMAIQSALDAASNGGRINFGINKTYKTTGPLKFYSGQLWKGAAGSQHRSGQTNISASGFTGSVIQPADTNVDTNNFGMENMSILMNGAADVGLDLTRCSYSRIKNVYVNGPKLTAIGILFHAGDGKCYFNILDQCKVDAASVNLLFRSKANANTILGGKYGNSDTGVQIGELSGGNVFIGVDFENNNIQHVYLDSPSNVFIGCHMEWAPIGYYLTINAKDTQRIGTSMASTVTYPEIDAGEYFGHVAEWYNGKARWGLGYLRMALDWLSKHTAWLLDAVPYTPTRTVLGNAAVIGDTSLEVASTVGLAAGDSISIESVNGYESKAIVSVDSDSQLTIPAMIYAHPAGTPVTKRATGASTINFFRRTNTSGPRALNVYAGDGSGDVKFAVDAATGNISTSGLVSIYGSKIISGLGSPEGSIAAPVSSLFLRRDGGANTTLYVKESGGGTNTGWIAK